MPRHPLPARSDRPCQIATARRASPTPSGMSRFGSANQPFGWLTATHHSEPIGGGIVGIEVRRLAEEPPGFHTRRKQAFGRLAHGALDLGLLKFRCNRADHARRHLILKLEYVFEDAVKMLCPQMAARRGIDELPADAQPVCRLAHAAFQHIAHPDLAAHLLYI